MFFVREPVVVGKFYENTQEKLKKSISNFFESTKKIKNKKKIRGGIVPHAAYKYSGSIASTFYNLLDSNVETNFIILVPNHSLAGADFALMKKGLWKTPLGSVSTHSSMAEKITELTELVEHDVIPHQYDHALEVQLPFLQYKFGNDFKFVPISIKSEVPSEKLEKNTKILGNAIADAIGTSEENWLILASSDFSHYISEKEAKKIDRKIINSIIKLNTKKLFKTAKEKNASLCGIGAISTAINAVKKMGSRSGKLLEYGTSADTNHDISSVVGYASILL